VAKPSPVPDLAPDRPLSEAAPALLAARLGDLEALFHHAHRARSPERVHDLRVATRRLRVALGLLGRKRGKRLAAKCSSLQDSLGAVRDLHVESAWLATLPPSIRSPSVAEGLAVATARAEHRLENRLGRFERRTLPKLVELAQRPGGEGTLGGPRLAARLDRACERVNARAATLDAALSPSPAHRLRIAVKKLRYLAELVEGGFPARVSALLAKLVPLQEALGLLHDVDVRAARLAGLPAGPAAPAIERVASLAAAERPERERAVRLALRAWARPVPASRPRAGRGGPRAAPPR
jgi:CHAD domain-containing protein